MYDTFCREMLMLKYNTFCHETLKYNTFCRETFKYDTFCRKMVKYGTFCRKNLHYVLWAQKNGKFVVRADSTFYATLLCTDSELVVLKIFPQILQGKDIPSRWFASMCLLISTISPDH